MSGPSLGQVLEAVVHHSLHCLDEPGDEVDRLVGGSAMVRRMRAFAVPNEMNRGGVSAVAAEADFMSFSACTLSYMSL